MQGSVYILSDPRDLHGAVRYVGKTSKGLEHRLRMHVKPGQLKDPSHKNHWVKSLLAAGVKPVIEEVEVFDNKDALNEGERYWISQFRALGFKLTNSTEGGDGQSAGFKHTPEAKAKTSAAMKGRPKSPETRAKMKAAQLARVLSPEAKESIRLANLGKKKSPETLAKMAAANLGKKHTEESKALMSIASSGRKMSAEARVKIGAAHRGKVISEETKSKISKSKLGTKYAPRNKKVEN